LRTERKEAAPEAQFSHQDFNLHVYWELILPVARCSDSVPGPSNPRTRSSYIMPWIRVLPAERLVGKDSPVDSVERSGLLGVAEETKVREDSW
jgi:hypothetical protein